jgi:serine/threonine protein kinase
VVKQNSFYKKIKISIHLGIHSLHNEKAYQIDLKPNNILLDEQGRAFLGDLGVLKQFEKGDKFSAHPSAWTQQEISSRYLCTEDISLDYLKTHIFNLGLVSLKCLDYTVFETQKNLNKNPIQLFNYLRTFRFNYPRKKAQIQGYIPREKVPLGFYYMLRCMLSFDVHTRPSIEEVHKDTLKFIAQMEVTNLYKNMLSLPIYKIK